MTFNYRLGVFGFFAHPELAKESGRNASGNYGMMDAVGALQWVKRNISAFGGDPNNVTVAGESNARESTSTLENALVRGTMKGSVPRKKLKRAPKGYPSDHRRIDLLRSKGLVTS